VDLGKHLPCVGAGGLAGALLGGGQSPAGLIGSRRANRSAVEPASRIQRTYPFSKPELKFLSIYQTLLTLFSRL
jgi:hypothetical protein